MGSIPTPQQIDFECGFVRLVDILPREYKSDLLKCDEAIVQAARVSYNSESKGEIADSKLVRFLMEHNHGTPLESIIFKFHIKCPIFVQRHIVKHRMTSMNEISARYVRMTDEWYTPKVFRGQSKSNRQASAGELEESSVLSVQFEQQMRSAYEFYTFLLDSGVAREQARTVLPQCMYTEFYLTLNLRSLMNLVYLRNSPDAQWETQRVAQALEEIWKRTAPVSWDAFRNLK